MAVYLAALVASSALSLGYVGRLLRLPDRADLKFRAPVVALDAPAPTPEWIGLID